MTGGDGNQIAANLPCGEPAQALFAVGGIATAGQIIAALGGVMLLGESLTLVFVVSAALVLFGVGLSLRR